MAQPQTEAMIDVGRFTEQETHRLAERFRSADPFPHVALESMLSGSPEELAGSFPDLDWPGWERFIDAYQRGKRYCGDIEAIPVPLQQVIHELSGPTFLRFLEQVTGVTELLPDPYLEGGGLHCTGPGGKLAVHTDFHWYPRLSLYRRVNVLLYLNPAWEPGDGGELQLFARPNGEPVVTVAPRFGTCVIFRTDDRSYHGVVPVANDSLRRSLALYYYTSREAPDYSGDETTYWYEHEREALGRSQRARLAAVKACFSLSRLFSMGAYHLDPNRRRG